MKQFSLLMFALMLIPIIGLAQDIVDPPLENPVLEARAIELHKRLRCMVCQNQSIHESNAELARDLRIVVRERLAAGDSDEQAIQYLVDRYGDWVLLKPPFKTATLLLWIGPLLILIAATSLAFIVVQKQKKIVPKPLTDEEHKQVEKLLR